MKYRIEKNKLDGKEGREQKLNETLETTFDQSFHTDN